MNWKYNPSNTQGVRAAARTPFCMQLHFAPAMMQGSTVHPVFFFRYLCYTNDTGVVRQLSNSERFVRFSLGGMLFEYDEVKNQMNIEKHGISFRNAARVFFDYDRIEMYDDEHSEDEDRYNTIGDTAYGNLSIIGNLNRNGKTVDDILFVVYADLQCKCNKNKKAVTQRGITLKMVVARQPKKEGDLNEPLPSS